MKIKFVRLHPDAKIPQYAHKGDSGMDISTIEAAIILPHSFVKLHTGLATVIPCGYELQVRPRSGLQCNRGVVGAWGTIDEGYRGEICIALYNHTDNEQKIDKGSRVAQLVIAPVVRADVEVGTLFDLDVTDRGTNGFGSTGL